MAGVCEGECIGWDPRDEPLTFMKSHSCELLQLYKEIKVAKNKQNFNSNKCALSKLKIKRISDSNISTL